MVMLRRSLAVTVSLVVGGWAVNAAAQRQRPLEVPPAAPFAPSPPVTTVTAHEPAPIRVPRAPPAGNTRLALGYRHAIIPNRGFDTFATDDRLSQLSLETSHAPINGPVGAFAAGVAWDFGSRAATTNGLRAGINVHRFTVPFEARVYLSPWAYAFGRVAPGVATYHVRITEPAAPLEDSPWVLAADSSAGVSFLMGPQGSPEGDVARVWFTPEVGYGWTQAVPIRVTSREPGPIVLTPLPERFPDLALRGMFFRAQIGFTL